jgi:hypothetical protein
MNRNCFGAVVGLSLVLAAMGLAKTSVWRQAGTISGGIAQLALIILRLFCVPRAP